MAIFDYKTVEFLRFLTESHPPNEATAISLLILQNPRGKVQIVSGQNIGI